jgi:hypothetical protein
VPASNDAGSALRMLNIVVEGCQPKCLTATAGRSKSVELTKEPEMAEAIVNL